MKEDNEFERLTKETSTSIWKNIWKNMQEDAQEIQRWRKILPYILAACALCLLLVFGLFIYGAIFPDSLKVFLQGIK